MSNDGNLTTGDQVELQFAQPGRNCRVLVNGVELRRAHHVVLEAGVDSAVRLQIDTYWPWPPRLDENKQPIRKKIIGYFVSEEDMNRVIEYCDATHEERKQLAEKEADEAIRRWKEGLVEQQKENEEK